MCSNCSAASDTPIYQAMIGDVLESAREEVERARRAAAQTSTALHASVRKAMDSEVERRAQALVASERAATAETRRRMLDQDNRLAAITELHAAVDGLCSVCRTAAPCATVQLSGATPTPRLPAQAPAAHSQR